MITSRPSLDAVGTMFPALTAALAYGVLYDEATRRFVAGLNALNTGALARYRTQILAAGTSVLVAWRVLQLARFAASRTPVLSLVDVSMPLAQVDLSKAYRIHSGRLGVTPSEVRALLASPEPRQRQLCRASDRMSRLCGALQSLNTQAACRQSTRLCI